MYYYSKSKYVLFCDCKKRLWCEKYHRDRKEELDNATVLANGNTVGALARNYFPNTILVDSPENNLAYMVNETKRLLAEGTTTIAEASFFYMNNYCACDLLHKNEDGSYDIYEVKSTTKVVDHYLDDIAYQRYVLTNCGLKIRNTYLMYINSFYYLKDEFDIYGYFKLEDLTKEVLDKQIEIEPTLQHSNEILDSEIPPFVEISKKCDECPFKTYCYESNGITSDSVIYLYNNKNKYKQRSNNIFTFNDLLKENVKLSEIQQRQIQYHYTDLPDYINKEKIKDFLDGIVYPIYFLDFESNQYVIPKFKNTKAFDQVCFQYSLHVLDESNNLSHYEYLGDEKIDYRLQLVEQLVKDLSDKGTIIAYNKGFEMTRIKEMAKIYPQYEEKLLALLPRFIDLADVFQKGYYYNKAMGKSFSIKSVLPALFSEDPSLDYHNLEGVHNGSEAMYAFDNLINLNEEERNITRQNLLKYCSLDTYAMVKIYNKLCEVIK